VISKLLLLQPMVSSSVIATYQEGQIEVCRTEVWKLILSPLQVPLQWEMLWKLKDAPFSYKDVGKTVAGSRRTYPCFVSQTLEASEFNEEIPSRDVKEKRRQ
nr:hypothetical protein [Tanacetum cinerariifolium]